MVSLYFDRRGLLDSHAEHSIFSIKADINGVEDSEGLGPPVHNHVEFPSLFVITHPRETTIVCVESERNSEFIQEAKD